MIVSHVRGPAFLASALINGDTTSFDDEGRDQALLDLFLGWVSPGHVVSCDDENEFEHLWINGTRFSGATVRYTVLS
jgi:hypothetical protein